MDRRAEFTAITRAMHLSEVSLPGDGLLRRGTLVAPSGTRSATPRAAVDEAMQSLPRFVVDETGELALGPLLGEGGMGAVHLTRQRSLRRDVAVKRLRDVGPEGVAALLAEARTTGALEHPSIVPVHALGLDASGAPLLVMKRVEGATLHALLEDAEHPMWDELCSRHGDRVSAECEILVRVAEALHFAHSRGVFHRDVKPANVMVGSFGEVYLLDWGVALRADDPTTQTSEIVGTPSFMAPEMVRAEPERVDARTDVYLLGATLHAILVHGPRHTGSTLAALLWSAFDSAPVAYPAHVPTELAELANRATAREPADRPPTALAFRDALSAFLRHRGAARLSAVAEEKMARLRASPGASPSADVLARPQTATVLGECRFALTQALTEWDGDAHARALLREALIWSVEAELARLSPDTAEAFVSEITPPAPGLSERIATARAELAERKRLEAAGRVEEHERDQRVGARYRHIVLIVTLILGGGLFLSAIFWEATRARPVPMAVAARGDMAVLGVMAALMLVFRRHMLKNRASRQLAALFLLSLGTSALGDLFYAARDQTSAEGGPTSVLLIGAVYLGAAIGLGGRIWWGALASYAAAIVGAIHPPLATSMVAVGCIACIGALLYDAVSPPVKSNL